MGIPLPQMFELVMNVPVEFFGVDLLRSLYLPLLVGFDYLDLLVLGVETKLFLFDTLVDCFKELLRELASFAVHVFREVAELGESHLFNDLRVV